MSQQSELLALMLEVRDSIHALGERVTALESRPAKASSKSGIRTFATKAEREAGDGFPCLVTPSCGRTDLRTALAGESHDPKAAHWHNPPKA